MNVYFRKIGNQGVASFYVETSCPQEARKAVIEANCLDYLPKTAVLSVVK